MAEYKPYDNRVGDDIFGSYFSTDRIKEDDISGVPYLVYMGEGALYPMMIIDSEEDFVDAPHHSIQQRVLEAAFDVIIEKPEVYFGSEAEMTEDDWQVVYDGYPELSVQLEMMLPPNNIRKDDIEYDLEELRDAYEAWGVEGILEGSGVSPEWARTLARVYSEIPSGAIPENASTVVSVAEELANAMEGGSRHVLGDAFEKLIAELEKAAKA